MNASVIVLSCDIYSTYWDWFFACKKKYWKNCPYSTYLVTETKTCPYCQTINIDSPIWTKRFREALTQIKSDYVIVMLEDYFIRQPVNQSILHYLEVVLNLKPNLAVLNFEQNYRAADAVPYMDQEEWQKQKPNQVYLNSTQPSMWNKQILIEQLQKDQNPWEWELTPVDNNYDYLINTSGNYIIDNGYRTGQEFGVKQGVLTDECEKFLKKEGLL